MLSLTTLMWCVVVCLFGETHLLILQSSGNFCAVVFRYKPKPESGERGFFFYKTLTSRIHHSWSLIHTLIRTHRHMRQTGLSVCVFQLRSHKFWHAAGCVKVRVCLFALRDVTAAKQSEDVHANKARSSFTLQLIHHCERSKWKWTTVCKAARCALDSRPNSPQFGTYPSSW